MSEQGASSKPSNNRRPSTFQEIIKHRTSKISSRQSLSLIRSEKGMVLKRPNMKRQIIGHRTSNMSSRQMRIVLKSASKQISRDDQTSNLENTIPTTLITDSIGKCTVLKRPNSKRASEQAQGHFFQLEPCLNPASRPHQSYNYSCLRAAGEQQVGCQQASSKQASSRRAASRLSAGEQQAGEQQARKHKDTFPTYAAYHARILTCGGGANASYAYRLLTHTDKRQCHCSQVTGQCTHNKTRVLYVHTWVHVSMDIEFSTLRALYSILASENPIEVTLAGTSHVPLPETEA